MTDADLNWIILILAFVGVVIFGVVSLVAFIVTESDWYKTKQRRWAREEAQRKEDDELTILLTKRADDYARNIGSDELLSTKTISRIGSLGPLPKSLERHFLDAMGSLHYQLGLFEPDLPRTPEEFRRLSFDRQKKVRDTAKVFADPEPWLAVVDATVKAVKEQYPASVTEGQLCLTKASGWDIERLLNEVGPSIVSLHPSYGFIVPFQSALSQRVRKVEPTLAGTFLAPLLDAGIPIPIPNDKWFEHCFLFAPTGAGKTNALSYLLNKRLDEAAKGEASVVLFDSTKEFVESVAKLQRFAPGGDLHGRLIYIDFEDVDHPFAINLFERPDDSKLTNAERDAIYNQTVEMLKYVYQSLLNIKLSDRQGTLMQFVTNLLLAIDGANLDTMLALMQPKGIKDYADDLLKTDADTQQFFKIQFDDPKDNFIQGTKREIVSRIFSIKTIGALARMMNAPKSKLDLFEELNRGRVILINAPSHQLTDTGVEIIGRFFLALMVRAMHRRAVLRKKDRLETYIFMDECQTVIKNDPSIETILDRSRKYRLSVTLASQRPEQLSAPVLSALYGNAAIKIVAQVADTAAHQLARNMGTTPEFLQNTPEYTFAAFVRGVTKTAGYFKADELNFDNEDLHMTDREFGAIRDDMRWRYSYKPVVTEVVTQKVPAEKDSTDWQ